MTESKNIQNIIFNALINLADELENEELKNPNANTKIYGIDGNLDSLALVSLIADLESELSDKLNINVVLADEKAMSMRNSPFRDVSTLTDYIHNLAQGK